VSAPFHTSRERDACAAVCALAAAFTVFFSTPMARAEAAARAEATARAVAVLESRADGVQPEAAAMVTRQLYATSARLGFRVIPEAETGRASRFAAGGPSPAELLRVAEETHADHALFASVGARGERYVVSVVLANADRTGPFVQTLEAGADSLESTVDGATRALLAAPSAAPPASPAPAATPTDRRDAGGVTSLALQTEAAIGVTEESFYNVLAGGRLDHSFPGGFSVGAYVGYLNAKGKDGRVSNVLPLLQLEYRIAPGSTTKFRIPVRFGTGYLPDNGPLLRFSAGVSYPLGDSVWLGLDLLAPTVWIVKDSVVLTMNAALEVSFAL
jgi:hypothetical protein